MIAISFFALIIRKAALGEQWMSFAEANVVGYLAGSGILGMSAMSWEISKLLS